MASYEDCHLIKTKDLVSYSTTCGEMVNNIGKETTEFLLRNGVDWVIIIISENNKGTKKISGMCALMCGHDADMIAEMVSKNGCSLRPDYYNNVVGQHNIIARQKIWCFFESE